jgi:hypothetical protein
MQRLRGEEMVDNIAEIVKDYKEGVEHLKSLREKYANEPELLNFYEPSAKYLVEQLKNHLEYLIQKETGTNIGFETEEKNVDIWIRLEGRNFLEGKGPVGVVGSYLQKLNTANKNATAMLGKSRGRLTDIKDRLSDLVAFDLVATGKGSLKLGLRSPSYSELLQTEQLDFFEALENGNEDNQIEKINHINTLVLDAFNLLVETVASVNNEELFEKLKQSFNEKDVLKLIHYAKELVPSSRSPFEYISFEGQTLKLPKHQLKTDKNTRKALGEREKKLRQDTEYIDGNGWLRGVDLDHLTGIIRPFHYKNKSLDQIDCIFSREVFNTRDVADLLDKSISLAGFLIYNQRNQPIRLDIDNIILEDKLDSEE